jgi:membrane protein DedA with SNARE-associated domain
MWIARFSGSADWESRRNDAGPECLFLPEGRSGIIWRLLFLPNVEPLRGTRHVESFVEHWGYLGVFLGIIVTGLGFPMPEELPVVVGGGLAVHNQARWWIMLPVCIVGVIVGDSCLYLIGRMWGSRLVERPFFKKHFLTPERLASITENFHKYGIKILLFARLTPGIRAPIFLTAGITRLSWPHFLIADGIYAIPGVSLLFFLGYYFTDTMVSIVQEKAEVVKTVIILVVLVGGAGYFLYRFLRRPMVTGNPSEVPPIMEPVSYGVDHMTSKILHAEADPTREQAPAPSTSDTTTAP